MYRIAFLLRYDYWYTSIKYQYPLNLMSQSYILPLNILAQELFMAIWYCNDGTHGHGEIAMSVCEEEAPN